MSTQNNPPKKLIDPKNWIHSPVIKLKDRPNRGGVFIKLEGLFGFVPEYIGITKIHGENNKFVISAELPEKEIKKRADLAKKLMVSEKRIKNAGKKPKGNTNS